MAAKQAVMEKVAEDWQEVAEARSREITKLRDQVSAASNERARWEKDVRSAAIRQAWDHVLTNTRGGVKAAATRELGLLISYAEHFPDNPGKSFRTMLAELGQSVREWLEAVSADGDDSLVTEIQRMRDAVNVQASRLHLEYGPSIANDRCGCPGCELIRAVNLQEVSDAQ